MGIAKWNRVSQARLDANGSAAEGPELKVIIIRVCGACTGDGAWAAQLYGSASLSVCSGWYTYQIACCV